MLPGLFSIIACLTCNRPLQDMIFNDGFWQRFLDVVMPFPLIGLMVLAINGSSHFEKQNQHEYHAPKKKIPLITAGIFLGLGLGGFLDGIIMHQLLQWHQMISNVLPPDTLINKQINTFWDGVFHIFTWSFTIIGMILLWRLFFLQNIIISTRVFVGSLLLGWGIFNAIDSILNHYILRLHNIRENVENPMLYNHAFFAFAIILMVLGWVLANKKIPKTASTGNKV
jgi:uncharacterized membrane protein